MFEKVKELKQKYNAANDAAEREIINAELKALNEKDSDAYAEAMLLCLQETNKKAKELIVREQLESVLPAISVSYIAKTYFEKSKEWFYQRLNGNTVNGKKINFTEEELKILNHALKDLGKKISAVNVSL